MTDRTTETDRPTDQRTWGVIGKFHCNIVKSNLWVWLAESLCCCPAGGRFCVDGRCLSAAAVAAALCWWAAGLQGLGRAAAAAPTAVRSEKSARPHRRGLSPPADDGEEIPLPNSGGGSSWSGGGEGSEAAADGLGGGRVEGGRIGSGRNLLVDNSGRVGDAAVWTCGGLSPPAADSSGVDRLVSCRCELLSISSICFWNCCLICSTVALSFAFLAWTKIDWLIWEKLKQIMIYNHN